MQPLMPRWRHDLDLDQESPVASKIKEAFLGEKGLAGTIKKLPLDKVFELNNVKQVRVAWHGCTGDRLDATCGWHYMKAGVNTRDGCWIRILAYGWMSMDE